MTARPPVCAVACAAVLLAGFAAGGAQAQDDGDGADAPVVVKIDGPCLLSMNGRTETCGGVAYMAFSANHRIDFTAITNAAGWAFSGRQDGNDGGRYVLGLDSVLSPSAGRVQAHGECSMQVDDDGATVRSLECRAVTGAGELMLKASGTIAPDDQDDDADDGDDNDAIQT